MCVSKLTIFLSASVSLCVNVTTPLFTGHNSPFPCGEFHLPTPFPHLIHFALLPPFSTYLISPLPPLSLTSCPPQTPTYQIPFALIFLHYVRKPIQNSEFLCSDWITTGVCQLELLPRILFFLLSFFFLVPRPSSFLPRPLSSSS